MTKFILLCLAIIAVATIEIVALLKGINGVALSLSIAALSGLGGYQVKSLKGWIKNDRN